ncbi:MAG: hypothetical protein ABI461_20780 [Polyangiaceae bacterium]
MTSYRLRRTDQPTEIIVVDGLDADGLVSIPGKKLSIGRIASNEVRVTLRGARPVLGGSTSYVIEETEKDGWTIAHTGHTGSMEVDDARFAKGSAPLRDGSRIELFRSDTKETAVAFTFEVDDRVAETP